MNKTIAFLLLITLLTSCNQHHEQIRNNTLQSVQWNLMTAESNLSFITVKNKTITEEHKLQFYQGEINPTNNLHISIDLNSIDTLIPIRDKRLRDILFKTEDYPHAKISTLVPQDLSLNQAIELPFDLDLHGKTKSMNATVMAQMADGKLVVVNFEPIAVNAKDFGMDDAINQLTKIAGLQSINYSVLVDFKLVFEK